LEITGNELQVWMFYYLSSGAELTAYPSIETVATHTGLSERTVKVCKRRLRIKGWMAYTGEERQTRQHHGHFDVPIMELRLPWCMDWALVVADVSMAYAALQSLPLSNTSEHPATDGSAISSPPTVVQTLHAEGSGSGSGSGSVSVSTLTSHSLTASCRPSDSNKSRAPIVQKKIIKSESESKSTSKPLNPEPTAEPTPAQPRGHASDGSPYPPDFNSWSNLDRLNWLDTHSGKKAQGNWSAPSKEPNLTSWPNVPVPRTDRIPMQRFEDDAPPDSAPPPTPGPCESCWHESGQEHHKNCITRQRK
jgi:hypothetical protein